MIVSAIAGGITLLFTAFLTIAGVGAAFILIPVFIALGIDVHGHGHGPFAQFNCHDFCLVPLY